MVFAIRRATTTVLRRVAAVHPRSCRAGGHRHCTAGATDGCLELPTSHPKASQGTTQRQWQIGPDNTVVTGDASTESRTESNSNLELMLRVSRLIEDDPAIAAEFARNLAADENLSRQFAEVCAVGEETEVRPPCAAQLKQVFAASALPFIGFGILDNAVMIVFGDVIDMTLCTAFGFSTMAAAALGNTFSDGIGVLTGGFVEDLAAKFGFKAPPISRAQQDMLCTRRCERAGQLGGITLGCLIGMFPLLLINWKEQEVWKRKKAMEHMYDNVVVAVEDILQAEIAMIMLIDGEKQELYSCSTAYHGHEGFQCHCKLGQGIMGHVAQNGEFLNIADLRSPDCKEYYIPRQHDDFLGKGIRVQSVLCMPVFGPNEETGKCDKVVGVVEVMNKRTGGHFTEWDEDALAAVCSHISSSLGFVNGEAHAFDDTLERCATALKCKGARINAAQNRRVHDLYASVLQELSGSIGTQYAELLTWNPHYQQFKTLATCLDRRGHHFSDPDSHFQAHSDLIKMVETKSPCVGRDGTALNCPIFDWHGDVIGAIRVVDKVGAGHFAQQDIQMLEKVSRRVSLTMEGPGSSLTHLLQELEGDRWL